VAAYNFSYRKEVGQMGVKLEPAENEELLDALFDAITDPEIAATPDLLQVLQQARRDIEAHPETYGYVTQLRRDLTGYGWGNSFKMPSSVSKVLVLSNRITKRFETQPIMWIPPLGD
jgi:hypothetical protein